MITEMLRGQIFIFFVDSAVMDCWGNKSAMNEEFNFFASFNYYSLCLLHLLLGVIMFVSDLVESLFSVIIFMWIVKIISSRFAVQTL